MRSVFRPRQPRVHDRAYLDWIKQLPCLGCAVEGRTTYGVDPAHIRHAFAPWTPVGGGEKPDDHRCAPMCRQHHDEQHDMNEAVFWARLGVNPVTLCADLVAAYPYLVRGCRTVTEHAARARQAKRIAKRIGGLLAPIEAAPEPVTVSAHLSGRRDAQGNIEVIFHAAGSGRDLIAQRAFVTPESLVRA
jgi:hypothetical protein